MAAEQCRIDANCTNCAVITSQFDVKPYQITYLHGFPSLVIESVLSGTQSPFVETLKFNRTIINKFNLSPTSSLYQMMDKNNIYLGIPMAAENNLFGFILVGGDRKQARITKITSSFLSKVR